jgi:hypothetical protein
MTSGSQIRTGSVAEIREKWQLIGPQHAHWFAVPVGTRGRAHLAAELRALEHGAAVVLCDSQFGSRRRCRAVARGGGVALTREFVALPTLVKAVLLVQDAPETARYVADCLLAPPPVATAVGRAQRYLTPILQVVARSRTRAVLLPGRVVFGHRA